MLANPSRRPCTFELARLFPGQRFRRLAGSPNQDPQINDGSAVGAEVTLASQDALFLVRRVNVERSTGTTVGGGLP